MSNYKDYYHYSKSRDDQRKRSSSSHDDYYNDDNRESHFRRDENETNHGRGRSPVRRTSSRDNQSGMKDDLECPRGGQQQRRRSRRRNSSSADSSRDCDHDAEMASRRHPSYFKEQKVVYTRNGQAMIVEKETWYRPQESLERERECDDRDILRLDHSSRHEQRSRYRSRSRSRSPPPTPPYRRGESRLGNHARDRSRSPPSTDGPHKLSYDRSHHSHSVKIGTERAKQSDQQDPCMNQQLHCPKPDANRRPDLRIVIGNPRLTELNRNLTPDDVVIVPSLFGEEQNTTLYHDLMSEVDGLLVKEGKTLALQCRSTIVSLKVPGKESATFRKVLNRLCEYFCIDQDRNMKSSITLRTGANGSNTYRNEQHYGAANITVGVTFGATREVSYFRSRDENPETATRIYMPLTNNSAFSIGHGTNLRWKHGINPLLDTTSTSLSSSSATTSTSLPGIKNVDKNSLITISILLRGKSRIARLDSEAPTKHPASAIVAHVVSPPPTTNQPKLLTNFKRDRSFTQDECNARSITECKQQEESNRVDGSSSTSTTTTAENQARVKIFIPAWAMQHEPNRKTETK